MFSKSGNISDIPNYGTQLSMTRWVVLLSDTKTIP